MENQNQQEIWQVDVNGEIYETNFEGLAGWIAEGSLLPRDKVRRGTLRWLEAGKTPSLHGFFNAKELGIAPPVSVTTNAQISAENLPGQSESFTNPPNAAPSNLFEQTDKAAVENSQIKPQSTAKSVSVPKTETCPVHADAPPTYRCEGCAGLFCKACPKTYGSVKICPSCGGMCKSLTVISQQKNQTQKFNNAASEGFGFADFAKALAYPFKFKASLIFGVIFFTVFSFGQSVWVFGGFMLVSAVFCAMLANTLTFGILANTVENFAQGKTGSDFMPRFDDFSAWDDVIHPFLLSIGVYLMSFGLLAVLLVAATWYAVDSLSRIDEGKQKMVSAVLPVPPSDMSLAKQSAQVSQLTEQFKKQNKSKDGNMPDENAIIQSQSSALNEAALYENLQNQIKQAQQPQTENANENNNLGEMPSDVMRLSLVFSIPIFLAFLWGCFYFPAACAVAGYTRSFAAIFNPLIGFDTIKRLGLDYAKILGMCLILGITATLINVFLGKIFAPLDLPQLGNIPVKLFDGILYFYISIVFSVTLGFVIHKNSRRLNLLQG